MTSSQTTVTIPVQGMMCASCVSHVQKALEEVPGVTDASVNLATEQATVRLEPGLVRLDDLADAVRSAGYDVATEKRTLAIEGMTCASCVSHVEHALAEVPGVLAANVNLATETASVEYVPTLATLVDLRRAVSNAGYSVRVTEEEADKELSREERKMRSARRHMLLAWAFTIPIILWMLPEMVAGIAWPNMLVYELGMLALAAPVLFWVGRNTYVAAWSSTVHGAPNMDALIALGTGVSYLTGIASLFFRIPSYAAVAAMIMAFHLTGRHVEASAKGRASESIRKLLQLGAKSASVLIDGAERQVPIEEVQVGDLMVVRPGEQIPTDGVIVEGEGYIDESMATGESMPVSRHVGSEVIGATISQDGFLKVRATRVGKDTFLAQVIRLVEQAQGTKVPIQALADRITAVFVPVVIVLAVLTFVSWLVMPDALRPVAVWASALLPWVDPNLGSFEMALIAAVSVLVIACPCALGLATPTALMVGSGIGAERGILIRSGEAIQAMRSVRVVVFDKTGTLTQGRPAVTDVLVNSAAELADSRGGEPLSAERVLQWAASVEVGSEHPLGKAVVRHASEQELALGELTEFTNVRGKGVRGLVRFGSNGTASHQVLVGSRLFLEESGVQVTALEDAMRQVEEQGKTAILVSVDADPLGLVAVADTLKPDAIAAVQELRAMGVDSAMLTGDNRRTALAIARQTGIERVLAEVLPEDKLEEIRRLQEELRSASGRRRGLVAMVGDGINDAPALTQADVGIAIGTGTDVAIEASDITLVRGDLSGVVSAMILSRDTYKKVLQGLFWAFFYNVIMVPLAVLGVMHPVLAEIAMATSSITVVTNANLLRRVDIRPKYQRSSGVGREVRARQA